MPHTLEKLSISAKQNKFSNFSYKSNWNIKNNYFQKLFFIVNKFININTWFKSQISRRSSKVVAESLYTNILMETKVKLLVNSVMYDFSNFLLTVVLYFYVVNMSSLILFHYTSIFSSKFILLLLQNLSFLAIC